MKKPPLIPKLFFLEKSGKRFKLRRNKALYTEWGTKKIKHYNYGYLGEYRFDSPSTTPLIQYYYNRKLRRIPMLFSWKCFGCLQSGEEDCRLALKTEPADIPIFGAASEPWDSEEDSVDERAEKFIKRFYAEMRLQRQESF
ncbi:hypothetical protein COLO4_08991 [Corchorus olitorius]|uniref:Uncharacterized protein n=1 Tax=Corchorus olitorius TaxID=93759 RepID=A0A1R3KDP1_9ROSI|nr:hypothetical protein COLO4_08991 [Corchorus olitorius]